MPAKDEILGLLQDYGCLEWAEGGDREEMAPYLDQLLTKIDAVLKQEWEKGYAEGLKICVKGKKP